MENFIYRGIVANANDTRFEVLQVKGHDYGYSSINFLLGKTTKFTGTKFSNGCFAEVITDGMFTRSLPPQGKALHVNVVSPMGEGIVVNGRIHNVETTQQGWRITIMPIYKHLPATENDAIVLVVPAIALENISPGGLVVGTKVSAVTRGMAALSMPPQMPVHVLLPYSERSNENI